MYNKISNTAERKMIESEFGIKFKFPKLYQKNFIINGANEATVSIITIEEPHHINYGIWGILPTNYKEDWLDFQNVIDTLSVAKDRIHSDELFDQPFQLRRCLIIVTGFFIHHLNKGVVYPYYVHHATSKPFALAGIYNVTDDGFLTCSIVLTDVSGKLASIENIDSKIPVVLSKKYRDMWLEKNCSKEDLYSITEDVDQIPLEAHPIAKEFFKNNIVYDSFLEPVQYKNLPNNKKQ